MIIVTSKKELSHLLYESLVLFLLFIILRATNLYLSSYRVTVTINPSSLLPDMVYALSLGTGTEVSLPSDGTK